MTITLTREEAQQVLDAMELCQPVNGVYYDETDIQIYADAIKLLRARLAQPEQEPVAWMQTAKRICSVTGVLEDDVLFKTYDNGIIDGIGDVIVCLTMVAAIEDVDVKKCFASAFLEIKDRKGYLNEHGIWIKDTK